MVVAELGFGAGPHIETVQEVAVATAPIESPIGVIEPGLVAARRFHWRALVDGQPVVTEAQRALEQAERAGRPADEVAALRRAAAGGAGGRRPRLLLPRVR